MYRAQVQANNNTHNKPELLLLVGKKTNKNPRDFGGLGEHTQVINHFTSPPVTPPHSLLPLSQPPRETADNKNKTSWRLAQHASGEKNKNKKEAETKAAGRLGCERDGWRRWRMRKGKTTKKKKKKRKEAGLPPLFTNTRN